jgi:nucleoside-diphosphate-sugar epimerase
VSDRKQPPTTDNGRILGLTGGTGFIGSALARRFVASGWQVRALVRDPARASGLRDLGVQLVPGDLFDAAALRSFANGTDAIVHCAGAVRGVTEQEFNRVNAAGLENLATAADRLESPPLFVSLSSLAAREPQLSPYAASKKAGEDALACAASQMRWIALRPPAVYGPGDREMLPLLQWMMRGVAPVLGSPDARFSLLYVEDLTAAIEKCICAERCPTGVFELHDGHRDGYDWNDIVGAAAAVRGKRVAVVRFPRTLLRALAQISAAWGKLSHRPPMLTPGKFRELTHPDWVCDNRAFSAACEWQPRVQFEEGLRRTIAHNARSR